MTEFEQAIVQAARELVQAEQDMDDAGKRQRLHVYNTYAYQIAVEDMERAYSRYLRAKIALIENVKKLPVEG